jgi:hypothetical protein
MGQVGNWTANVSIRAGNQQVLDAINFMSKRGQAAFFPGTFLRDYGDYALPAMPIIYNGNVIERIKQTGQPYIDNYVKLAQTLGVYEPDKRYGGSFMEPHMSTLQDKLRLEIKNSRRDGFRTIVKNGLRVLPVICNEIYLLESEHTGEPVDCILHSADGLYFSQEQREKEYWRLLRELESRGKITTPLILGISEGGENPFTGTLVYSDNRLEQIK